MNDEIAARLKAATGPKGFTEDPTEIAPHLEEWRSKYKGRATLMLKPATTTEVSAVLSICNETSTPIVPQAGNTGLVGGQIPFDGEVLLSLSRLNRIRSVSSDDASMICEAGVILAAAQHAADDNGMLLPLSLAAEGSCTVGGTVSTNAGGVNVLRYGMAREQVLGLEVVLADGRVLDLLRTLRKDNTGYDLKQLFIGAEGTLGVVTAVALKLSPKPAMRCTAFLAVPDVKAALTLLTRVQGATGNLVNAFEIVPRNGLEFVLEHIPGTADPLQAPSPWYVLCEASGAAGLSAAFEGALATALSDGLASDAAIASNETQRAALWKLRESMSEAQKKEGPSLKHDVSVPVSDVANFIAKGIDAVTAALPGARPVPFGHLGDGNIHFNIQSAKNADMASFLARWDEIARIVHDVVRDFGGSFSAEHGIGVMKRADLARYKSPVELDLMRVLKRTFDPKNILNPGKLVPE
ncbi:MAG: FAD-binding oxidoreductase [Alphaproteobacteria bacterium]|nr:FAD-binding oxidoreductase [Alphaproteobacteria bacterium]MDE2163900.1 FAD-binding oxidoreductase [Alphaproteobacteria bacterium]